MIQEDFLATIKLTSAEEVVAHIAPLDENKILITDPVVFQKVMVRPGTVAVKVGPWLTTTSGNTFIIEKQQIITLVECFDAEIIELYTQYLKGKFLQLQGNQRKLTKEEGYVSNVQEVKQQLERIFGEPSTTDELPNSNETT